LRHAAAISGRSEAARRDLSWVGPDLRIAEEGETALFVGCLPNFDVVFGERLGIRTLDIARAAIRLLNRKGIEPVLLDRERCCGHDQLWGGDRKTYEQLARANIQAFQERGVRQVLSVCAECTRTWRKDYPELDAGTVPRTQHVVEWLAEQGDEEPLFRLPNNGGPEIVTFQDPCRLGRHLEVYDPPRDVIDALPGVQLAEMSRTGRDALCCGTSGFQHCDAESRRLQRERLESARRTGAATLLTACPKCWIHFSCAQHDDERQGETSSLEVMDLTLFAASRLCQEADLASSPRGGEMGVVR
jgi:Fe-S oxidoreductase